ncbi:MAG: secretion protein HlyD family protein, partial [Gemmatimonadetes bacterium]|nr:secretion protein HlyD family protein [Gemmatimonadota bacterium]
RLVAAREDERARADLAAARAAYEAAAGQASLVRRGVPADARGLSPLTINAPGAGVVRGLSVAAGQAVAAGAPLAEIVQVDRLWIRVAVYAGEVSRVARSAEATVHGLGGYGGGPLATALPITGPPTADPTSASVDLYYELRGGTALRPGERVGVTIPLLNGAARALVVPLAALVRDMSGGTWVYERTTPVTFVRRRVEVSRVVGGRAVLAMGPAPGTLVVTAGAAELFGTEFGAGK